MLMTHHVLLLANLEDTIKVIITIIVMVMWGVGHLVGAAKPKPKAPPRPRPLPPAEPGAAMQGGPPGPGQPATLEETLRREVEEFMRRAQGRPAEPPKRPLDKPQSRPQQQGARREAGRSARPSAASPAPVRRLTDSPGGLTTPQATAPPTGAAVGQHVMEHLTRSTQQLAAHAQHLGSEVAQADERMEEHLQQKFAHQLGALEHRAAEPVKKAVRSPMAQDVLNMLAQPGGVRQLIVASEILRRPEERWRSRQPGDA
jgi:hypothetical protein